MKFIRLIAVNCLLLAGCTPQVTILVPDMMCEEGCAAKVHEILSEQPGARQVVVNFDAKTATVKHTAKHVKMDLRPGLEKFHKQRKKPA